MCIHIFDLILNPNFKILLKFIPLNINRCNTSESNINREHMCTCLSIYLCVHINRTCATFSCTPDVATCIRCGPILAYESYSTLCTKNTEIVFS